jgi:hypothetical protein
MLGTGISKIEIRLLLLRKVRNMSSQTVQTVHKYPVVAEIYSLFEATLQNSAKKLVEDIARQNNSDPKVLWEKIRPRIQIGLLDVDLPDELQTLCSHMGSSDGAVKMRCRAPCVLGFNACPKHVNTPLTQNSPELEKVDRIMDYQGVTYFVNSQGLALDKYGKPKGYVDDGALTLFEKP